MTHRLLARILIAVLFGAAVVAVAGDEARPHFYGQDLDWGPCESGLVSSSDAECADLEVPLDYSDPGGRTITVAVSRVRATDPEQRRGVLLSNPGGPGASGLDAVGLLGDVVTPQVRAQYDLIGFDPRGLGESTAPPPCGWPVPEMVRSTGIDPADFEAEVDLAADLAGACMDGDTELLRQLTTRNTARDMDVLRSALGEETINFFGLSYGTYLGAVYTEMFSHRSDRFVFDSAIDPDRYWTGLVQDWGPADEIALDAWARWAAAHDDQYHLGTSAEQIRTTIDDLVHRAARDPIVVGEYSIDDHLLPFLVHNMLHNFRLNHSLAGTVRALVDAAAGRPVNTADSSVEEWLSSLHNNENSLLAVIACGDGGAPKDPEWYRRAIEQTRGSQPIFGAMANNIQPCAFWPRSVEAPTVVRNEVPALIVNATGDPRTPYPGAVRLHQHMSRSRLVTLEGVRVHLTFRPGLSACVSNAINGYLVDGNLPEKDITCHPEIPNTG